MSAKCDRSAGQFFNRPELRECILLEDANWMACNGEIMPTPVGLIVPQTLEDYETARDYYTDKEFRLYKCLRFRRRCN